MLNRNIFVSTLDYSRLRDLVRTAKEQEPENTQLLEVLEGELARAKIVAPDQIPPYVVTMNTCVHLTDSETGQEQKVTLVYPGDAESEKSNLSILTDLGVAIIGFSVGDTIPWNSPEGPRYLRINSIDFQPEATKQYDL